MKSDENRITWKVGKNICEIDTSTWCMTVRSKHTATFAYAPKGPVIDKSVLFHYIGNGDLNRMSSSGNDSTMNATITTPQVSFSKRGNYTVTLLARNLFECTDTLVNVMHVRSDSKIVVPEVFSDNRIENSDSVQEIGFNLKSIHEEIYGDWVDRIFEFFELDTSWEGTFRGHVSTEKTYSYMIDAGVKEDVHTYLNGNVTVMY